MAVQALDIFDSGFSGRINSVISSKNSRPSEHLSGWSVHKTWYSPHFGEKYESRELQIFDFNCPMKTTLLPEQISRIVRLAWEDRTSFEEIEKRTGFVERDVIAVMRRELKPSSFRLWRKRVNGRITKHRRLLERKLKGPLAAGFDD
jgi:uncharacterized protein (TIGR03643 family)